jgi:chemotaxis protein methyltransferase WspC
MKLIEQRLHDHIGLDVNALGPSILERTVQLRITTVGLQTEQDYCALLDASPAEWAELVESVVVPETWFFRDREPFLALSRLVRNLSDAKTVARRVRLLSLPCSTGEEPYSMAMALLDAGIPASRFQIDAADLSRRALAVARQAVYGRNSFRGDDLGYRDRHFHRVQDGFVLNPAVREPVRFFHGNLLEETFLADAEPYDFVFCRNLLIYFDRAAQTRALKRLATLLRDPGFLFVGAAELPLVTSNSFVFANLPLAFACRKPETPRSSRPANANASSRSLTPPRADETRPQATENRPHSRPARGAVAGPADLLEAARRLADSGQLREAAGLCERHLELHGVSAEGYYLLGLIDDAQGLATAAHYYRKALYLDPNHHNALVQMSLLCTRQGDAHAARVFQRRAERIQQRV